MTEANNKIAIVTGAGTGVGRAASLALMNAGFTVVLAGRRLEMLQETAKLGGAGKSLAVPSDMTDPGSIAALFAKVMEVYGRLDVLFNNAGIFAPKPFLEVTEAEYDRFLDNILKGTFFTAQAAAKAMKAAGRGGAIVQTGSMWALQAIGATPSSAYSAAKAGVHALVKNLAIELAPDKIRVNAIAPAVIETPVYDTFLTPEQVKEVLPTFNAFHPLGRNGQVADVAEAMLFLASDQASFITGVVLPVDGGVMAGRQ